MALSRIGPLVAVTCLLGTSAAGCGGGSGRAHAARAGRPATRPGRPVIHPDPRAVNVIKAWSTALRRGDVRGAARYFALPSVIVNGTAGAPDEFPINDFRDAVLANETLPCGAVFVSAREDGRFVNALFRLTDRRGPGGGCGPGVGGTARTDFLIRRGRIVEWVRAPNQPGEDGSPGAPPAPQAPGSPGGTSAA